MILTISLDQPWLQSRIYYRLVFLQSTILACISQLHAYIVMNISTHTCTPYYPYALRRESHVIGRENKESICRSTNRPYEGNSQVSAKPMKVTKPPENLLERISQECRQYQHFGRLAVGMKLATIDCQAKVFNISVNRH